MILHRALGGLFVFDDASCVSCLWTLPSRIGHTHQKAGGASAMAVIDSQVHAYEANTSKRPWASVPNWPPHVTGDEMVAAMDKVGVDGAIFISAFSLYKYDASYAVEVQRAHPNRLAIVKPLDPDDPATDDVVAAWKTTPGAVGIRIFWTEAGRGADDPGFNR